MDKLDILNRDKFVEQLVRLIENISDNKTSTCFAINGEWGSGKSFVLDMFEEELNGPYSEKYFVVRYNCWKYDYYEEPLIAIVSAIISEIEKKTKFFPDSQEKQEILGMFKAAGVSLLSLANTAFKTKTGIDFQSAYETVIKGKKEGAAQYEKEHAYDTYLGLNKVIDKLSGLLQDIAERYTVVIIVDELDRCIPDYAIKVLERLHHLTEEKKNIITVVAVDKGQLESSVKQLFGFKNPSKYLEKFFDFEIKLDKGEVSEKITEKYADYVALFDKDIFKFNESVEECLQEIFRNIDVRAQEHIVKKAMLVHKLIFFDKKDYVFMCMELLITTMMFEYGYEASYFEKTVDLTSYKNMFVQYSSNTIPAFVAKFDEHMNKILPKRTVSTGEGQYIYLPGYSSLYAAIFCSWYSLHMASESIYVAYNYGIGHAYDKIIDNTDNLKKFVETLNLMK